MFNIKSSIKKKIVVSFSVFIILFSVVFSGILYLVANTLVHDNLLPQFANTITMGIKETKSELELQTIEKATSGEDASYRKVIATLDGIKEKYSAEIVYVVSNKGGKEHIVATDTATNVPSNTDYPFTDEMKKALKENNVVLSDIYTDEYGEHKSGFIKVSDDLLIGMDMDASFISKINKEVVQIIIILTIVTILIGSGIAYIIGNNISKRIRKVVSYAREVAAGNLSTQLEVRGTDELAQLATSMNEMNVKIGHVIEEVLVTSDKIVLSSEDLSQRSKKMATTFNETMILSKTITQGSDTIVNVSGENAQAMDEITQGVQHISESACNVLEEVGQASKEAEAGTRVILQSITQMSSISTSTIASMELIETMNQRMTEIEKVVTIITGIAAQINLLALNAAIEAARAGEHGRGFSVVADEVRKLAEQSAVSAKEIVQSLQVVKDDSEKSVAAMKIVQNEVESGTEFVHKAGNSFDSLYGTISKVNNQINRVTAATQEIAASTEEVNASLEETTAITHNALENSQQIEQSTQEQLEIIQRNVQLVEEFKEQSLILKEKASYFKI